MGHLSLQTFFAMTIAEDRFKLTTIIFNRFLLLFTHSYSNWELHRPDYIQKYI